MAYQLGKAANIAPPAVISQTSLPSHTGPMVLSTARRRDIGIALPTRAQRGHQHADTEVEALEHQEAEEQHGDQMNHSSCSAMTRSPQ